MRGSKIKREKALLDSISCPKALYKREKVYYSQTWRARRRFYFVNQPRSDKEVAELRFKPVTVKVRCCNKLHTVKLTTKGSLVLKDHPNVEAELMLGLLGAECRCLDIYLAWKEHTETYAKGIPAELEPSYRSLKVIKGTRWNKDWNKTPVLSYVNQEKPDLSSWYSEADVRTDSYLGKACIRILKKAFKELGIKGEVEPSYFEIVNDLRMNEDERRQFFSRGSQALQLTINPAYRWEGHKGDLKFNGRLQVSTILRLNRGQGIVNGHLYIGKDEDGNDLYLRKGAPQNRDLTDYWSYDVATIEGGQLKWKEA